tara:strand:+ start:129 stop:257 length:129 start_codon:yes stop_codon:yes gene_type:complete
MIHVPIIPPKMGMTYDRNTPIKEQHAKKAYVLSDISSNTGAL